MKPPKPTRRFPLPKSRKLARPQRRIKAIFMVTAEDYGWTPATWSPKIGNKLTAYFDS